ncbi:uncharacterized protein PHACADRAFT_265200 [Phanerochaete carnosa HHB-10118-sp]|uniref:Uncharacterized protein n=1 Tax=Phanerochaete carnosa (strain HHB-10118-sp) TaxID=650164 RepID=K5WHD9_PHACS|nr:uncharacterized protein PHACADRAFT_265200 [Phanerochaete carnosa HHB-10118-sp]EKM49637.1 hypothetical protein PHACADRAFT_265200 [Phanerochaete carnosa HHB-10118-sp]
MMAAEMMKYLLPMGGQLLPLLICRYLALRAQAFESKTKRYNPAICGSPSPVLRCCWPDFNLIIYSRFYLPG